MFGTFVVGAVPPPYGVNLDGNQVCDRPTRHRPSLPPAKEHALVSVEGHVC